MTQVFRILPVCVAGFFWTTQVSAQSEGHTLSETMLETLYCGQFCCIVGGRPVCPTDPETPPGIGPVIHSPNDPNLFDVDNLQQLYQGVLNQQMRVEGGQ